MRALRLLTLLVAFALAGVGAVVAQDGSTYGPQIPKAAGGDCVEDTEYMRRNHMDLLQHHRDDTMREGIRTERHSLKGCINCHAVKNDQGQFVSAKDERHFCRACHDYTAVKPDCFACHASKPGEGEMPAGAAHGTGE